MKDKFSVAHLSTIAIGAYFCFEATAFAYIGPGAGFAFLGSGFVFVITILMAIITIAFWPVQKIWRLLKHKGISKNARTRRVVIVGLDGLEPSLVDRYMAEGSLPHMKQIAEQGSYQRLGTTLPALSPVAWSSFQTGVNPGAHNIFDFLTRDKRTCLPQLASSESETVSRFKIWGHDFGFKKTRLLITRKSQPFWKILGKHGIVSNVIRVPISYPPEKFEGNILSAMCTPDLKGTQGSFTLFTNKSSTIENATGGQIKAVNLQDETIHAKLEGPPRPDGNGYLTVDFQVKLDRKNNSAQLSIKNLVYSLQLNQFSPWIELNFELGSKRVSGICRFCLRSVQPEFALYVSPVNINPEKPALPISHPIFFSSWLSKRQGFYGTLGLLEDTWGRNEYALDDQRFLDQAYLNHAEREQMFFDVLDRTKEGVCVCVFDASDRIQHMFWRYLDQGHPSPLEDTEKFANTIPEMYKRMDQLVGKVRQRLSPNDVLIILSDHGFSSFRRGINLNTWLIENGYLTLKGDKKVGADYFVDVDWSRSKAFAVGLSGLYINVKGREQNGIVKPDEVAQLKAEIASKLQKLLDPLNQAPTIRKVYDTAREYRGLYSDQAPDLIVGYAPGYRVSWESVTGAAEKEVFSDNIKAWSGDHHIDPEIIPGVLFCNRKTKHESARIVDIAPTVLDLFSVKIPAYMEGKVLL